MGCAKYPFVLFVNFKTFSEEVLDIFFFVTAKVSIFYWLNVWFVLFVNSNTISKEILHFFCHDQSLYLVRFLYENLNKSKKYIIV